jgi:hypothetical protein
VGTVAPTKFLIAHEYICMKLYVFHMKILWRNRELRCSQQFLALGNQSKIREGRCGRTRNSGVDTMGRIICRIASVGSEVLCSGRQQLVMPQFGSEPKFEPEPAEPNSKFSSRFRDLSEPNLKSSSRFSQQHGGSNLN